MQKKRIVVLSIALALALSACGQSEAVDNSEGSAGQSSVENIQPDGTQGGQVSEDVQPTEAPQPTAEPTKSPEELAAEEAAEEAIRIQELYDNRPICLKQMADLWRCSLRMEPSLAGGFWQRMTWIWHLMCIRMAPC